jgi:hypothetical protein
VIRPESQQNRELQINESSRPNFAFLVRLESCWRFVWQEGVQSITTRTRGAVLVGPDLPPHLPIRRERKQPRLRTAFREGHLLHRQVDAVRLLSCASIIASVFF